MDRYLTLEALEMMQRNDDLDVVITHFESAYSNGFESETSWQYV